MASTNTAHMFRRIALVLAFLTLSGLMQSVLGQNALPSEVRSRYGAGGVYRYVDLGERFISVGVHGSIRLPGLYEIPVGTDINTLISMAGGAQLSGSQLEQDTRTLVFKLFRDGSGDRSALLYEYRMEDVLTSIPEDIVLEGGDVLTIDSVTEQGFVWRDYLTIASAGISAILLIVQLAR